MVILGKQNVAGTLRSFVGAKQNVAGTIREALYIKQNVAGTIRTLWQKNTDTSTWWGYHGYTASNLAGSTVSMSGGTCTITNVTLKDNTATFTVEITSTNKVVGYHGTYFAGYNSSGDKITGNVYYYNYRFSNITLKFPASTSPNGITRALFTTDISDVGYSYYGGYTSMDEYTGSENDSTVTVTPDSTTEQCIVTTNNFSFDSKASKITVTITITAAIQDYSNELGVIVTKAGYCPTGTLAGYRKPSGDPYASTVAYYNFTDGYTGEFTVNRSCRMSLINATLSALVYLNTGVIQLCDTSNTVLHTFCNKPTPNDNISNAPVTVAAGTYKIKYTSLSYFASTAPFVAITEA